MASSSSDSRQARRSTALIKLRARPVAATVSFTAAYSDTLRINTWHRPMRRPQRLRWSRCLSSVITAIQWSSRERLRRVVRTMSRKKAASGRLRKLSRWRWSIRSAAKRSPPDHSPSTSSAMPRMGTAGGREGEGGRGWLMDCTTKAARRGTQAALCLRWEE